jgi:RNA polymerase sigma-70 factor, ECF subfamily
MASDEELVTASMGGDTESFNQLVRRWERPIYALAYRTLGREEDARDVCQETFLRAFRSLNGFRGQAKFSSWLYRIALNLCRDWMRRERRAPVVQAPEGVDVVELASELGPVESIEDLVSRRDLGAMVQKAMSKLSEEQRTTIILKEYQGLTFQEIADLQGCPLSTVKTRLYQGLSVLRRELDRQGVPVPTYSGPSPSSANLPAAGRPAPSGALASETRRQSGEPEQNLSRGNRSSSVRLLPPLAEPL